MKAKVFMVAAMCGLLASACGPDRLQQVQERTARERLHDTVKDSIEWADMGDGVRCYWHTRNGTIPLSCVRMTP